MCGLQLVKLCDAIVTHGPYPICALYRCSLIHDKVLYKFRLLYFTLPHPLSLTVNLDILLTRRRLCNKIIKASQTVSAIEHWELVAGEGFFLLDVSFV